MNVVAAGRVGSLPVERRSATLAQHEFGGRAERHLVNDLEWFRSRAEAVAIIETWRSHYNLVRPHSSLGYRTPEEFSRQQEQRTSTLGRGGFHATGGPMNPGRSDEPLRAPRHCENSWACEPSKRVVRSNEPGNPVADLELVFPAGCPWIRRAAAPPSVTDSSCGEARGAYPPRGSPMVTRLRCAGRPRLRLWKTSSSVSRRRLAP